MAKNSPYDYVEVAALSDMGCIRTNNEDAFLTVPEAGCFVVADGMGGGEAGEVASATVVDYLQNTLKAVAEDSPGCRKYAVQQSLHKANGYVVNYRDAHHYSSMGTTVVMLLLNPWNACEAFSCHVGDSRLYCLRGGELFCVTRDHSMANEMKSKGSKEVLPDKIGKALVRVIGGSGLLVPEWQKIAICPDDMFLLCSDGIIAVLSDSEIETIMREGTSPEAIVEELKERVRAGGAPDNLTAVCVKIGSELPLPMDIEDFEREESDLLLKVAEERKDFR